VTDSTGAAGADLARLRITDEERQPGRRRRRWPWLVLAVVAVLAVAGFLTRPAQVRVATAHSGGGGPAEQGKAVLTANGYVEARHQASVAARTTGRLAEVMVEEGDTVSAGQVVARLLDEDQIAAVARAEADLQLAEARLAQAGVVRADAERRAARRADLGAAGVIGTEENETAETTARSAAGDEQAARAQVAVARAALRTARLELDKTRVTAPFAGAVLRKDAEVGEIVGPIMTSNTARAGAVVTIADLNTLEVGVDVSETYIARLGPGMAADVVLDAHPETHFPGEIRAIFPSADRDKATIPVRVRFLALDARVRPDLGAKVTFLQAPAADRILTVPKVLRVPAAALREQAGQSRVWRVRNGRVEAVTVTPGERGGDSVVISAGLEDGDQVVVDGAARLRPGQRVRIAL
jgi:RND family efflux transporter MFP subunit